MVIQQILFPKIGKCTERELYFRTDDEKNEYLGRRKTAYYTGEQKITFSKGARVSFDTYFNGLTVDKWFKYTVVKDIYLNLHLKGQFRVVLLNKEHVNDDVIEKIISEKLINAESEQEYYIPYNISGRGMYTFKLEALSDDSVFYGGAYCSDVDENQIRSVKIGLGICTFRREKFVENNIDIIRNEILDNNDSPMSGHLEVFISDNGKTLDIDRLQTENIHIFPNRNLGGAGGFTRDLIEMMNHNQKYNLTHALLMDDDVVIEPEALIKTYTILSLIKDEYVDAFIGGAMLRLDKQYAQVESGATWNGGYLDSLKHGLDLRSCEACLYNEVEETTEFNAWWYCCFPISIVGPDNLPLPIFIRGDDLEYGLRNMKKLILMNGICVWHEPFENKYSSFLEYYIIRNLLIDNAFHCQWYGAKQLNKTMFKHCIQEIMLYRYKNVDLYLQGVKDFLKGPQWLMQQDGEALHKKIMESGYKAQDLDNLNMPFSYPKYKSNNDVFHTKKTKLKRNLTLNGLLLPAKGENVVSMTAVKSPQTYRMSRVMYYDASARKAFIAERSFSKSVQGIWKTILMVFAVNSKLKRAQNEYRTEGVKMRTLEFWNKYLGLG